MKVIVLGADGYLGWPTCMHLKSKGHDVIAVDNYIRRQDTNPLIDLPTLMGRTRIFEDVSGATIGVEELDIANFTALDELFADERPDAVVHYAEPASEDEAARDATNLAHAVLNNCPDCHIVKLGALNLPDDELRAKLRVTELMQGSVYGTIDEEGVPQDLGTHFYYDSIFGTPLNRFVVQAVVGHSLTVTNGESGRGYIDLRDAVQCVNLAVGSPPDPGEHRVVEDQFTERFSELELAERVQEAGLLLGMNVGVRHTVDEEAQESYLNAEVFRSPEFDPHILTSDTILEMIEFVKKHRDQVNESLIER
jgi:UDP-sulfoquinovose synthase